MKNLPQVIIKYLSFQGPPKTQVSRLRTDFQEPYPLYSTAYSSGRALSRKLDKTRVLENLQDVVLGKYELTKAIY